MYWTHRWFHGRRFWKYHAVHHSSEQLEWISAARFHPVNLFLGSVLADVVMLFAGISPNVFVVLGPLVTAHSAFVHANLDWTLGPVQVRYRRSRLPPLASHCRRPRRREEFCRNVPASRRYIRHVLYAGRRTAGSIRHRRSRVFRRASARSSSIRSRIKTARRALTFHEQQTRAAPGGGVFAVRSPFCSQLAVGVLAWSLSRSA